MFLVRDNQGRGSAKALPRPSRLHSSALILGAMALCARPFAAAAAGVAGTPLPRFADGKQALLLMAVPGVIKKGRVQTDFLCTSLDHDPVDIGVEIFDTLGNRLNDITAGAGAVLDVSPGHTTTIGTGATSAYLETQVIPLAAFSQGFARIVGSSNRIRCNIIVLDDSAAPPVAIATLSDGMRPVPGPVLPTVPLPRFADGHEATHAVLFPGVIKRGRMQSDVFCTSLAIEAIDIGVEMFGPDGAVENNVADGNGAVVNVPPGATVTFGTTGTAAFLETQVIAMRGVAQGFARVVTTSPAVTCAAMVVDSAVTPPTALSALFAGGHFGPGDVNQDGAVNAADLPALVRAIFP